MSKLIFVDIIDLKEKLLVYIIFLDDYFIPFCCDFDSPFLINSSLILFVMELDCSS